MAFDLSAFISGVLANTARQLELCCHREVGNIPARSFQSGKKDGDCC